MTESRLRQVNITQALNKQPGRRNFPGRKGRYVLMLDKKILIRDTRFAVTCRKSCKDASMLTATTAKFHASPAVISVESRPDPALVER